jgi:hypothetical protein
LPAPLHMLQQPADMAGMIPDAKFLVDDHCNAAAGPELASKAIGVGAAL